MKRFILFGLNVFLFLVVYGFVIFFRDDDGKCAFVFFIEIGEKFYLIVIFRLLNEIRSYKFIY